MEKYLTEQEYVVKFLTNSYKKDRLSHSYLFIGEKGTHKLDIAKEMAKLILCENNCCNECNICRRIDTLVHPNVKVIFPENGTIKKEVIVELQNDFSKTSLEKGAKIYIIVDAHLMNDSSSNSLLKFIEEPVGDIYGILTTTNEEGILPTIKSRSQKIYFKSQDRQAIKENLLHDGFDEMSSEILPLITNSLEEAINLGNDDKIKEIINSFIDTVKIIGKKSIFLHYNLNCKYEKEDLRIYLKLLADFFRDVLYFKVGIENINFKNELSLIEQLSNKFNDKDIVKVIDVLVDAQNKLTNRLNEGLLVDSVLLKVEEVLNESR